MQPRGSQYFRKPFNGVANMAAYEIQLKLEYGIIAYINGKEVFREHMPAPESGVITPSTPSSGSFATPAFHGVIRPASEVSAVSSNVLAVELHFSSLTAALLRPAEHPRHHLRRLRGGSGLLHPLRRGRALLHLPLRCEHRLAEGRHA